MRPEDIRGSGSDADEIMQLIELNMNLEKGNEILTKLVNALKDQVNDLRELAELTKIKEFAMKMYINTLEEKLNIDEEDRMK